MTQTELDELRQRGYFGRETAHRLLDEIERLRQEIINLRLLSDLLPDAQLELSEVDQ